MYAYVHVYMYMHIRENSYFFCCFHVFSCIFIYFYICLIFVLLFPCVFMYFHIFLHMFIIFLYHILHILYIFCENLVFQPVPTIFTSLGGRPRMCIGIWGWAAGYTATPKHLYCGRALNVYRHMGTLPATRKD